MKLYAACITAEELNSSMLVATVFICFARNEAEAIGKSLEFAKKRWNKGFYNYQVEVLEVSDDTIRVAYRNLGKENK